MAFAGERFRIPLGDDADADDEYDAFERSATDAITAPNIVASSLNTLVKDIQERPRAHHSSPTPPVPGAATRGFPPHRKRDGVSRFKQARIEQDATTSDIPASRPEAVEEAATFQERERAAIEQENRERLATMSDEAIAKEREELLKGLSPALIERFMRRANINPDTGPEDFPQPDLTKSPSSSTDFGMDNTVSADALTPNDIRGGIWAGKENGPISESLPLGVVRNQFQHSKPLDVEGHLSDRTFPNGTDSIHFPRPPAAPELDMSSPTFLADLHSKYFPSLSSDPSKLAWMTDPYTVGSYEPSYSPLAESISTSALRFSFRGILIPPRSALSIPVTEGLHHHGDAPESAGYTIPELAHLARSSFAAQRCVAFQTLGRIIYRLGKGEFGCDESDLADGLWKCIEQGRVLESLHANADKIGGHMSSKAYATEALWLWQKGGGQRVKAV